VDRLPEPIGIGAGLGSMDGGCSLVAALMAGSPLGLMAKPRVWGL
jgi:hypothetical protein